MQKCKLLSFFLTSMTALHQVLWLGLMTPDSNISLRWFLTSSTISGGIRLNCSLNGVSSVTFMVCSVEWVHPSSAGSNENTSWYLARSWQALSANSGAHKSKPLRSNSLNSLPCLCLIINFGVWGSGHTSSWTCRLPGSGIWVLVVWPLPLPQGSSFREFGGRQCCSAPPLLPSCCPSSVQYTYSAWSGQVARCHPGHAKLAPSC